MNTKSYCSNCHVLPLSDRKTRTAPGWSINIVYDKRYILPAIRYNICLQGHFPTIFDAISIISQSSCSLQIYVIT